MKGFSSLMFLGFLGLSLGAGNALGSEVDEEGESTDVIYKGQNYVAEKKKFSVLCTISQFDPLKWTHNGKPVVHGEGGYSTTELSGPKGYITSRLSVESAHMYHAGEYKCTTFSPRSHTVYVLSASQEMDENKVRSDATGLGDTVQMVYVGYPLKLACNFTDTDTDNGNGNGNGEGTTAGPRNRIELDWYKNGELLKESDRLKIFQDNSTMLINMPLKSDNGVYRCETQTGEETLSKTITVIYLEIKKMDKSQNVVEKEAITIECPADGFPPPSIMWLKDQKPIAELYNDSNSRLSVGDNTYKMVNGSLTINDAQWGDRGNYSCIVTSLIQSYEKWTYLRVKDVYAALWPFIGIVIEVVILGIIIIIFEKRRAKAEFDESDTDPGNDQKNTADRSKDMRRRK